jgi:hypothetical protein
MCDGRREMISHIRLARGIFLSDDVVVPAPYTIILSEMFRNHNIIDIIAIRGRRCENAV